MKSAVRYLVMFWIAAIPALSQACGLCDEDKVAATYDHATEARAFARGHVMVFAEITGPVEARAATAHVSAAATKVRGVQPGTLRTSVAPAAFSFELDPKIVTPAATIADFERRAVRSGARFRILRVTSAVRTPPARLVSSAANHLVLR